MTPFSLAMIARPRCGEMIAVITFHAHSLIRSNLPFANRAAPLSVPIQSAPSSSVFKARRARAANRRQSPPGFCAHRILPGRRQSQTTLLRQASARSHAPDQTASRETKSPHPIDADSPAALAMEKETVARMVKVELVATAFRFVRESEARA